MGYPFARATHYSLPATHVLSPLCLHILTNCFFRNAFVFTTIRIAPGCGVQLRTVSIWESFGVYPWHQLQCVLVVDLLQDFVGDLEAVDAPERVPAPVILEIFVARFQRAEIPFVFV